MFLGLGGGGHLGFGFGDDAEGLVVGSFAFAGLIPEVKAAVELLLGALHVDLLGLESVGGQDGDAIGQNLDESPTDVVASGIGAVDSMPAPV